MTNKLTDRHTIDPLSREKFGVECIIKHIIQCEFLSINPISITIVIIICMKGCMSTANYVNNWQAAIFEGNNMSVSIFEERY